MEADPTNAPAMDDLDSLTNFDNMDGLDAVEGMDGMDDLFLDPGPSITMSSTSPVKGLPQRLEELQMSGCCQNVAWSKMGCIAYITPDRLGVKARAFTASFPSDTIDINTSPTHESMEIVHVCWDRVGSNLAVVDSLGRVSIYKTIICLNNMILTGKHIPDPSDTFSTIIGMDWSVPQARAETKICHSATRNDDSWSYNVFSDSSRGPSHPIMSSHSIFFVTRGGALHLLFATVYQEPENGYGQVSTPLSTNITLDNLLTHASFATAQDDTMLLATYDVSRTLRIYRVAIEWNYPFAANQRPPPTFRLAPALKTTRLLVTQGCAPGSMLDGGFSPRLSHFHFLPALEDTISNQSFKNEIFGVFNINDTMSQIWRWELQESREELQQCFQQLAPKKHKVPPTALGTTYTLTRRKDIDIPSALVSVIPLRLNTIVALCRSDGTIMFRDRQSMEPIISNLETGPIHSLIGAGFSFPPGASSLAIALSPNACIAATTGHSDEEANTMALRYMEQQPEYGTSALQAFALTFATTCLQNYNNDDLLEIIRQRHQKNPINIQNLLDEMYIAVRASESAVIMDHRQLMGNQFLFRCFGMQLDLGPLEGESDQSSDVAWMLLNMRLCVMALHVAWDSAKRDSYRPELPASLLGLVSWYIDTMIYIVGDLIRLSAKASSPEAFREHVSSTKSLAMRLMLSSISRVFLRSINRYLRYVDELYKIVTNYPARIVQGWQSLVYAVASSPVDVFKFDSMLAELDHYVKGEYETAGTSDKDRMAIERSLLLSGNVPDVLMPVAERLVTSTLGKLMEEMKDPSKVVFANTNWLWASKKPTGKGKTIDVLRKVPLTGLKTLRRCTRCESFMENLEPRNCVATWILQMQKQCPCGNPWVVVEV